MRYNLPRSCERSFTIVDHSHSTLHKTCVTSTRGSVHTRPRCPENNLLAIPGNSKRSHYSYRRSFDVSWEGRFKPSPLPTAEGRLYISNDRLIKPEQISPQLHFSPSLSSMDVMIHLFRSSCKRGSKGVGVWRRGGVLAHLR